MAVDTITALPQRAANGDLAAKEALMRALYRELHALAAAKLGREHNAERWAPGGLVHEAWLRMGGDQQPAWTNRAHFFGAAAEAMRRILIDRARHRNALRHGGRNPHVSLDHASTVMAEPVENDRLLAVDDALEKLALADRQTAELVKLRYFAGLSMKETALTLGISQSTAWRRWQAARTWLEREFRSD